ncbi:MAG: ATP-binding protein [Pegethrix bostrychoides GSE-TBD4-15B]|jgi:LuxR family glucitol operon transcriptional activator|uniref:ATP-binding protein n=1 Tax=Pegethrix bostrychoides GSE-TBD4-15B TaxID=2839662 RepID=A0A951PDU3_9CYAN|nr:ATP-binding protein [Pegethrix bostrychoides GSE-TBD4-15B]
MNPENAKIEALIDVAQKLLAAHSNKLLDLHEKVILRHILAGRSLKTVKAIMGNAIGYEQSTIERQIAPKLWKALGETSDGKAGGKVGGKAGGKTVGAKNVRLFLEEAEAKLSAELQPVPSPDRPADRPANFPPPALLDRSSHLPKRILHNLPQQPYNRFIGRQAEVARLLKLLLPSHAAPLICITGLGGVGKTSLTIACARRCLHASCAPEAPPNMPIFDMIIYSTAKQHHLTYSGLQTRRDPHQKDLVRQIIEMLDRNNLIEAQSSALSFEEQITLIYRVLAAYRTLLIVDNLEVVENQQDISDFLCDLPLSVKTIITTREGISGVPMRLSALPEDDGLSLVQSQAGELGVSLRSEDSKTLYQLTGGLPIAIDLAVGQLAWGYSMQEVQSRILQPTGHLAQYCFEGSVQSIHNQPAYWLLLATVLFPEPALRQALIATAIPDLETDLAEDAMVQLQTLSLITQARTAEGDSRYWIISLTRSYLLAELARQPQFEQAARSRWVNWYLDFSECYRSQDPAGWQGQFDGLDQEWENIQAVADYCMKVGNYADMLRLWQNLKPYFYITGRGTVCLRYWQIGLTWTKWLIDTATERQDWRIAGTAMFFQAWVLIEAGDPSGLHAASDLLEQAWNIREHQDLKEQANLARQIGLVQIKQQSYTQAQTWLSQSEAILEQAGLDERKRLECLSHTRYYQGWAYLDAGEIAAAKSHLTVARDYAQTLEMDRLAQVIETSIADVATAEAEFDLAARLLTKGLQIAETNADYRRVALIQLSFARLAQAQADRVTQQQYATAALAIFEQIGMTAEAERASALIAEDSQSARAVAIAKSQAKSPAKSQPRSQARSA